MMLSKIGIIGRCLKQCQPNLLRIATIGTSAPRHNDLPLSSPPIVDINMDEMMIEDPEFASQFHIPGRDEVGVVDNGAPLAPVDINAWVDDEEAYEGTVDIEKFEKKDVEYPPAPKERVGVYEFKGLKIVMPKSMHDNPGTYRYRMTSEEMALPDDIRICKFEPKE